MTTRLSIRSLAGMERTLVAVGTARLASMLVTTRAAGPLRVRASAPENDGFPACVSPSCLAGAGAGFAVGVTVLVGIPAVDGAPSARESGPVGSPVVGGGFATGAGLAAPFVEGVSAPAPARSWGW